MASVKHRNLASILDVDQYDGVTFLVMEYISGMSLSDMLRDGNRMSSVEAARIMWKLAEATGCAHTSGVVHRDIKPGNIIIDECNEPILMDFGLAYSDSEDARMTKFGAILGTPAYMAPEQLHGASHLVGPHSDIYALGAILYELLTGSTVYPGSTSQVLDSLAKGEPALPPSEVQPNIDPWLEAICTKAIAHQPSQRFQSTRELADAFHYYLSDDKVQLQLLLEHGKPAEASNHKTFWIAAVIVVAMAFGGVYFLPKANGPASSSTIAQATSAIKPTKTSGPTWSEPERVKFISGKVPATNASISGDGLHIVFMVRTEGGQVLCESIRSDRDSPFSEPRPIRDLVLDDDQTLVGKRYGNPWLSHDGLEMILYCIQPGIGADLFHTHRDSLGSLWKPLRSLGSSINSQGAEYAASMTQDKLTVFWFRPHSANAYDGEIWTAVRSSMLEEFGSARLLGSGINTMASEQHPCVSDNGLLLTFDRGTPDPRLWQSRRDRTTDEFGEAYPLDFSGVSPDKNAYCPTLTADGNLMIFTSNEVPGREGFETGELWQCHRVP
jgi:serine/threonine protein kinase